MIDLFILGCFRSGTSLLRTRLNNSDLVYIPEETKFLHFLSQNNTSPTAYYEVWKILRRQHWVDEVPLNFVKAVFSAKKDIPSRFWLVAMYGNVKTNLMVRGDKTPYYTKIYKKIPKIFKNAKIVYMVRDGRDVYASVKHLRIGLARTPAICAKYWIARCRPNQNEKNTLLVYYEELVYNPDRVLQGVSDFLDLPQGEDNNLKDVNSSANILARQRHHVNLSNPINTGSVGTFKEKLSGVELIIFEACALHHLRKFGYKIVSNPILLKVVRVFVPVILVIEFPIAVIKTLIIRRATGVS